MAVRKSTKVLRLVDSIKRLNALELEEFRQALQKEFGEGLASAMVPAVPKGPPGKLSAGAAVKK